MREDCLLIDDRYPNTTASNDTGKSTPDTPRVGRHAGFMSKRVVSTHSAIDRPDGEKLQTLYRGK